MKNKTCYMCNINKPLSSFNKCKKSTDGLDGRCHDCYIDYRKKNYIKTKELRKRYNANKRKNYPWDIWFNAIKNRCNNKNNQNYRKYGGKGIKFLLTKEDIKNLWIRDNAFSMKNPSIDRKDSNKNYIYENCQFLELSAHGRKTRYEQLARLNKYNDCLNECRRAVEG